MLVVEDRVGRLRTLMLVRWHLLNIRTGRGMTCIMVVIAVRLGDCMMCIGLIILELVGVVLSERGIEILLLVGPSVMLIESTSVKDSAVLTPCSTDVVLKPLPSHYATACAGIAEFRGRRSNGRAVPTPQSLGGALSSGR